MAEITRILDSDLSSLEARVARTVAGLDQPVRVSWFTLWYTCRPPVHGAVLRGIAA